MNYRVTLRLFTNARGAELDAHLGPLYEELLVLHGIEDPDLAADIERGKVEVTMVARAEDDFAALMQAVAAFRAAVHSLGDVHEDLHPHLVSKDAVSVVAEDREPIGA
jgi:hypothetical protein